MSYSVTVIKDPYDMQHTANGLLQNGKKVAFVPTMGYLHDGHLALMREGRKRGDVLVASIFINPTQFGPNEDLTQYPRDLNRDIQLAGSVGVDLVFAPEANQMYEKHHQTVVELTALPKNLCGLSRPGHFTGVTTIVAKLFNIIKPRIAVFGEKDYQQLIIVKQMVQDLNMDINIVSVPTVREPDGLAMSSRNVYLSDEERLSALSLYASLGQAQAMVDKGVRNAPEIIAKTSAFIQSHPHTKKDYVVLCDPASLEDVDTVDNPTLMALAIRVGKTRLIDNIVLKPPIS